MKCKCGETMIPCTDFGSEYFCPACGRTAIDPCELLVRPLLVLFLICLILAFGTGGLLLEGLK